MYFEVNGKKLSVAIDHNVHVHNCRGILCRATSATILDETKKVISIGVAICQPSDQFNKTTGRKLAVTKALKSFSRAERTEFWMQYLPTLKLH